MVFDPKQFAAEEPTWWWNPLSYVDDNDTARDLAQRFAYASRPPTRSSTNSGFDGGTAQSDVVWCVIGQRGARAVDGALVGRDRRRPWCQNCLTAVPGDLDEGVVVGAVVEDGCQQGGAAGCVGDRR